MKSSIMTVLAILGAVVIISVAITFSTRDSSTPVSGTGNANNVSIVDGKQIIDVSVKGGYHPQKSIAKAGVPTILRFNTNGTFDCSSTVRIPSLGLGKNLPSSGATDIDIGSPKVVILQGVCGMGMYSFEVDFQG